MQHTQKFMMMFNSLQAHKLEISSVDGVRAVMREFSGSMRDGKDEKYFCKKKLSLCVEGKNSNLKLPKTEITTRQLYLIQTTYILCCCYRL